MERAGDSSRETARNVMFGARCLLSFRTQYVIDFLAPGLARWGFSHALAGAAGQTQCAGSP